MIALLKAFSALAPIVKDMIVAIVEAIKDSPDPEAIAKRALDETRRQIEFEKQMRARVR